MSRIKTNKLQIKNKFKDMNFDVSNMDCNHYTLLSYFFICYVVQIKEKLFNMK